MHALLQSNFEALPIKRWRLFLHFLYLDLTMCLALAHGMLANVIQAEILKEIRAHFAYAWKI